MFSVIKRAAFRRVYPSSVATLGQRYASNRATSHRRLRLPISGGMLVLVGVGLGAGAVSPLLTEQAIQADSDIPQTQKLGSGKHRSGSQLEPDSASLGSLIRAYIVYSMCSFPTLIDAAPKLLDVLMGIPVVRNVTEAFVRVTFFDQFVGGDTAQETLWLLHKLRAGNKGTLFAYSIEVDESGSSKKKGPPVYKRCVNEMIRSIDVAADFEDGLVGSESQTGRRTWVAIKMTALLPDAQSLIALSSHIVATRPQHQPPVPFPGCPRPSDLSIILDEQEPNSKFLTDQDIASLRELYSDLRRISIRAKERGVKLIIDAEYSWYQPAVDAIQLALMREFNKNSSQGDKSSSTPAVQPLIYGTFQAYLRRTPLHLAQSYRDAQENNYALGVKLVRGAYHTHEIAAYGQSNSLSISPDSIPPVWMSKNDTDKCYDECVKMLIGWVKDDVSSSRPTGSGWFGMSSKTRGAAPVQPKVGALFGTHNRSSVKLVLNELISSGLASTTALDREDGAGEAVLRLDAEVAERITFGQLFGMCDSLTDYIVRRTVSNSPMVIKYVPYGALSETMPYLSRRAIENKSVLGEGQAVEERKRAGREIWAKLFG
ncbi:FAD-linked oxidoreductase [Gymnopus androsaceus JB14]|uniref:Proline dehydrogenase n=1 Tax=Gymnopus androsaceus JB14 TaxID=1447944 RepID=A0A6A4HFV9_9AGAR|nr:FAD-linked oxidoreductase [Gymnopus androsaceus JB14]